MPVSDITHIFQCRMCGQCCKGKGGIVVSPDDLAQLSVFLHLAPEEIVTQYTVRFGEKFKLDITQNGYCVFFQSGKGCGVHDSKPAVCKAWPFFRGNIEDTTSLDMAKSYCPGITRDVPHADFAALGIAWLKENNLQTTDSAHAANTLILR